MDINQAPVFIESWVSGRRYNNPAGFRGVYSKHMKQRINHTIGVNSGQWDTNHAGNWKPKVTDAFKEWEANAITELKSDTDGDQLTGVHCVHGLEMAKMVYGNDISNRIRQTYGDEPFIFGKAPRHWFINVDDNIIHDIRRIIAFALNGGYLMMKCETYDEYGNFEDNNPNYVHWMYASPNVTTDEFGNEDYELFPADVQEAIWQFFLDYHHFAFPGLDEI